MKNLFKATFSLVLALALLGLFNVTAEARGRGGRGMMYGVPAQNQWQAPAATNANWQAPVVNFDANAAINAHREYLDALVAGGIITRADADYRLQNYRSMLDYRQSFGGGWAGGFGGGYGGGWCGGYCWGGWGW